MVAVIRDRSARLLPAAVLALLLVASIPPTLAQQEILPDPDPATSQAFEVYVKQGEAVIKASASSTAPLKFLDGNRTQLYYVTFPLYNSGAAPAPSNLPIYYWFDENTTALENRQQGQQAGVMVRCTRTTVSVEGADAANHGVEQVGFLFEMPRDVRVDADDGEEHWVNGYTMRILVNRVPLGLPQYEARPPTTCPRAQFEAPATAPLQDPTADDGNAQNNMIVAHFVRDARLDLQVETVKWCRGNAVAAENGDRICDQNVDDSGASRNWVNYTSDMSGPDGFWFNTTRKVEETDCTIRRQPCSNSFTVNNETYFEVRVKNSENASWRDPNDYGGACTAQPFEGAGNQGANTWYNVTLSDCPHVAYNVDIRLGNLTQNVRASPIRINSSAPARGWGAYEIIGNKAQWVGPVARSLTWDVINWTGPFRVYATVNDNGALPEVVATNNDLIVPPTNPDPEAPPIPPFEVGWSDFQPQFVLTDLKTTPDDPYPYREQGGVLITGKVFFPNLGPDVPTLVKWVGQSGDTDYAAKPIAWTVRLDNLSHVDGFTTSPGTSRSAEVWNASFTFDNNTDENSPNYIAPGKHWLCAKVDVVDEARETNEANNEQCVAIYLADSTAPTFNPIEGKLNPRLTYTALYNGTANASFHPNQTMYVHANATDDDIGSLTVTAQFTLNSNASVVRNYTMARHPSGQYQPNTFTALIEDFRFAGPNATTENWTLRVIARDSFGNNATTSPTTFQLKPWPIQTKPMEQIVLGIPRNDGPGYHANGSNFSYSDDSVVIRWRFNAPENDTGLADQERTTRNFGLRVFAPNNKTYYLNGTQGFESLMNCPTNDIPDLIDGGSEQGKNVGCTDVGLFQTPYIEKSEGGPGQWYAHIEVTDKGGNVRVLNQSFLLKDGLPTIWNESISHQELEAGQSLVVKANMTDDFAVDVDNGGARVNFTRKGDNKTFSIPLTGRPAAVEGGRATYAFNNTIETGYGKALDEAGEFDVRFVARDNQGNWNASAPLPFKLNDTRAPDLHEAAVDQPLQEVGQNVTWTARVTDQTNVTVKLRVHPAGSDEDILRVNLTPTQLAGQNFTHTANFTREGNYVWELHAIDSAGLTSSVKSGPLTIADNLGPRFQVVEPGVLVEGKRYARAAPVISIIVSDTHGVDKDSINVTVGGQRVTPDNPVPAPGGLNGFVVNYTVPATEKFRHGDVVSVNLTALDLSPRTLRGFANFTFTVDDVAPVARVKEYAPRYPTEGTGTVNVSLRTKFTLEATDDDGQPTGVESIRYRIFGGGNNAAETVYNDEPFTIADTPGVYTGPKIYQIQYWAVDAVGNQKTSAGRPSYETLTVYVDGIPPSLDPFGSLPQGRFVNATFIDDRSGVDRAIVWYSTNGAPYAPQPLDFVAGVWTGVLPEGRKGDSVAYYLEVFDRVENRETFGNATDPYTRYTVGNHAPAIRITAPAEGSRIQRTVDLTWTASDEDNDPLTFTVFVKAPGDSTFRELAKLESSDARKYAINTANLQDGQYTFRVSVTDLELGAAASTTVTVLNRASAFGAVTPPPGEVEAGTPVVLQVEVTKAEALVEARVYLDGDLVETYRMNDNGTDGDAVARDGKYSARVLMSEGGRYSVTFFATYPEDGVQRTAEISGGEFVVEGGGIGSLGLWLAVLGLAVVVGLCVAAVLILRGRKGA